MIILRVLIRWVLADVGRVFQSFLFTAKFEVGS